MSSVSTHCPVSTPPPPNLPEILRTDRLFPVQILRVLRLLAKPLRRVRTVCQRPVVPPFHNANETGHSSVEQLNKPLIMPISTSLRDLEQVFFSFYFFCFCFFSLLDWQGFVGLRRTFYRFGSFSFLSASSRSEGFARPENRQRRHRRMTACPRLTW